MAASRTWTNPKLVTFTPNGGGSAIVITKVQSVSFDAGGQILSSSGDGDRYPTTKRNIMNEPTYTVNSLDVVKLIGFMAGTYGTLTWVMEDGRNDNGSGDVTWTLVNACPVSPSFTSAHAQMATGALGFEAFSVDGLTNPLTYSVAT